MLSFSWETNKKNRQNPKSRNPFSLSAAPFFLCFKFFFFFEKLELDHATIILVYSHSLYYNHRPLYFYHSFGVIMGTAASSMAAKLAFYPPSPPSYNIVIDEETGKLRISNVCRREDVDVLKLSTKKRNEIVAIYVKNPSALLTVLYSHGNAADIGQMHHLFSELSLNLNVNLMGLVSSYVLVH